MKTKNAAMILACLGWAGCNEILDNDGVYTPGAWDEGNGSYSSGNIAGSGTGGDGGSSGGGAASGSGANNGGGTGGNGGNGPCTDGATEKCYPGDPATRLIGTCADGTRTCAQGVWGACTGAIVPTTEICNGADDDCDGNIDEGFAPVTCGQGVCQVTIPGCSNGMVTTCTPIMAQNETCNNGVDDDCDGKVDEDCTCVSGKTQPCYSGNPATKNVGLCHGGTQTCVGGSWGSCIGQVLPTAEICDDDDNNCNGTVDEGYGIGGACTAGTGACARSGKIACDGSGDVACNATPGSPSAEVCDNIDNDCNGSVDDCASKPQSGSVACADVAGQYGIPINATEGTAYYTFESASCGCGMSNGVLKYGELLTKDISGCHPPPSCVPSTEKCDGMDNDCDGAIDEDYNIGGTCSVGLGACARSGSIVCDGYSTVKCNGTPGSPTPETCNGIDDDCDNYIDEGNVCNQCPPCTSQPTNASIACSAIAGIPEYGVPANFTAGIAYYIYEAATCGQPCNGVQPQWTVLWYDTSNCHDPCHDNAEICNGLDDNCNGAIDENNPGGGEQCGACNDGTTQCSNGSIHCVGGTVLCFVAGTGVSMADGTTKPIEQIQVGDIVLAYDIETQSVVPEPVIRTFAHPLDENSPALVRINGDLVATTNHPFYANGKWVSAEDLGVGDSLVRLGTSLPMGRSFPVASGVISSLDFELDRAATYNIEVENMHNYFAGGVLVHNKVQVCP